MQKRIPSLEGQGSRNQRCYCSLGQHLPTAPATRQRGARTDCPGCELQPGFGRNGRWHPRLEADERCGRPDDAHSRLPLPMHDVFEQIVSVAGPSSLPVDIQDTLVFARAAAGEASFPKADEHIFRRGLYVQMQGSPEDVH